MKRKALHFSLISMLLIMLLLVASVPSLKAASEEPRLEWSKTYPRFPNYFADGHFRVSAIDEGYLVIQTTDGGYAIAAVKNDHHHESHSGGVDNRTCWLIKTDALGNVEWEKETLKVSAFPRSLFQTKDSGFLISGWGEVLKTDANGMVLWNKTFETWTIDDGKLYYTILSAIETADGGFVFAGRIPDHPYDDAIIMKFDKNGNLLWNNTFGSDVPFEAYQVIEMDNDDVAAIGDGFDAWFSRYDSNGKLKVTVKFNADDKFVYNQLRFRRMVKVNDEGFVLGGSYQEQGVLAKIDSEGTMKWNLTFYNPPYHGLAGLKPIGVTKDGGYLVEGGLAMVKVDDSGKLIWNVTYSNLNVGNINSMVGTEDGGFVAVGQSNNSIMLAKFALDEIPEFPLWAILPLVLIITLVLIGTIAVTVYRRKLTRSS